MTKIKASDVDEYIRSAPEYAREKLNELRLLLKSVAPNASEELKWGQPVFIEKRIIFSYAAFKKHFNFTPTGPALYPFREELASFETGKDSVKFTYEDPLPAALIKRIAEFRYRDVMENDARWMY